MAAVPQGADTAMGAVDVGVQRAFGFRQGFAQPVEIAQVIIFAEEAGLSIMATLDDVQRNAIKLNAGAAGHDFMLAQNN